MVRDSGVRWSTMMLHAICYIAFLSLCLCCNLPPYSVLMCLCPMLITCATGCELTVCSPCPETLSLGVVM